MRRKPKSLYQVESNIFSWLSDVPEFLSPRVRLLLFTVMVALILTLIMEFFNVDLFFGGGAYVRGLLAIVIALAIYMVFERISEKISHN